MFRLIGRLLPVLLPFAIRWFRNRSRGGGGSGYRGGGTGRR